jgi:hypothetical protein
MADAETLIDRFLQDQDDIKDVWYAYVINPFASAYDIALSNFEQKLKEQQEARIAAQKAKWEMFVLVLSLCGGGILTAAFGSTAAKTIVADQAMKIIYERNLVRAFNVAHILSMNKTAGFIAGKAWDEMEKRVGDKISDAIKPTMSDTPNNFASVQNFRTWSTVTTLENFVLEAKIKGADMAKKYRDDPTLTSEVKLQKLAELKASKFFSRPTKPIDNGKLAEEIELSFYLALVMKSDYMREFDHYVTAYWGDSPGDRGEIQTPVYKNTEITVGTDTIEYGQRMIISNMGYNKIYYKDLGSVIRKRLNELYKMKFKEDFMKSYLDHDLIVKAERGLAALGSDNITRNIQALAT